MTSQNNNDMEINHIPISSDTGDALFKPAASSIGNAVGTVLDGIFHVVLDPVRRFNIQKEHDLKLFQKEIQEEVNKIPIEYKDDSKVGIVLKSIEDSRYQLNEVEIRILFEKLISASFDSRKNANITPIFSTILSNMTPKEAKLLEMIYKNPYSVVTICKPKIVNNDTSASRIVGRTHLLFKSEWSSSYDLELTILSSHNLINVHEGTYLTHELFSVDYEEYKKYLDELKPHYELKANEELSFEKSYVSLTELGQLFCDIVFED